MKDNKGLLCVCICLGMTNNLTSLKICKTEIIGMPWKNPCGGQSTGDPPPTDERDKEWMIQLVIILKETRQLIDTLKASYYLDPEIRQLIEGCNYLDTDFLHLDGFPELNNLRSPDDGSKINISTETSKDYRSLASFFVFFEQILWDKDTHGGQKDWDNLCSIFGKLRNSLCILESQTIGSVPGNFIPDRSIMKREYRLANNITLRMKRNYIIFKDATKIINTVIEKYVKLYFNITFK